MFDQWHLSPYCGQIYFLDSERPLKLVSGLKDQKVTEGEPVSFTCELTKSGQPVQWLGDGKPLRHGVKYKISTDETSYTLTLPKPTVEDSAEYTAKVGDVATKAKLVVSGERKCD